MKQKRTPFRTLLMLLLLVRAASLHAASAQKPNVLHILCDDLGYGDVKCLGGERSKIATPQVDMMASQGMIFTEARSSSAVCSPTICHAAVIAVRRWDEQHSRVVNLEHGMDKLNMDLLRDTGTMIYKTKKHGAGSSVINIVRTTIQRPAVTGK